VSLPALKSGTHVSFSFVGADAAVGFGGGLNVGSYSYTASNGAFVTGAFVSPALAVGAGASLSAQKCVSWNLDSFFGNSGTVSGSIGAVGGSVSANQSGMGGSGGLSAGAKFMGESSFAMPVGQPHGICFR
jgi:hypothetical protein